MIIKTPEVTEIYSTETRHGTIKIVPLSYEPDPADDIPCGCTDKTADNYDRSATEECNPSTCIYLAVQ